MNFNISDLFYNLIPGVLFTLAWYYALYDKFDYKLTDDPNSGIILLIVIIGLFVGFVLQTIWVILKRYTVDPLITFKIANVEKDEFDEKNRWLWKNNKQELAEYFSGRNALWGNIATGSFLSIAFFIHISEYCLSLAALAIFVASLVAYNHYKQKQIDTVGKMVSADELKKR